MIKLIVENRKIKYRFELHRRVTYVIGKSATGKTELLHTINAGRSDRRVKIECERKIYTSLSEVSEDLEDLNNALFILDENSLEFKNKAFISKWYKGDIWILVLSRDIKNVTFPCAISEVYEIVMDKGVHTLKRYYDLNLNNKRYKELIVEDSGSGYEFYSRIAPTIPAKGNDRLSKMALLPDGIHKLYIIDSSNGAREFYNIYLRAKEGLIDVCTPESFEYVILKTKMFYRLKDVKYIFDNIEKLANSKEYISWERFFSDKLNDICLYNTEKWGYKKGLGPITSCLLDKCCNKGKPCNLMYTGDKTRDIASVVGIEYLLDTDYIELKIRKVNSVLLCKFVYKDKELATVELPSLKWEIHENYDDIIQYIDFIYNNYYSLMNLL